jgi:hypothetical protein
MTENNMLAVLGDVSTAMAIPSADFDLLAGEQNNFQTRLQLYTFASNPCKDKTFPEGHWGLVTASEIKDLGESVTIVPIGVRPKAMDVSNAKPVIAYRMESPLFTSIREKAGVANSNCMCGVEYLVFLPEYDAFTTFYMANKTLRREAQNVKNNLGNPIVMKTKLIQQGKNKWHGVVIAPFPTPIQAPAVERIKFEQNQFMNPPTDLPVAEAYAKVAA